MRAHTRNNIFRDPFIVSSASLGILMLVLSIFVGISNLEGVTGNLIVNLDFLNSSIPGDISNFISILGIFAAIMAINSVLTYEIYPRDKFIAYVISLSTVTVAIFIFITTLIFVSLN